MRAREQARLEIRDATDSLLRYIKSHNQVPPTNGDTDRVFPYNTRRNRNPGHPSNRNSHRLVRRFVRPSAGAARREEVGKQRPSRKFRLSLSLNRSERRIERSHRAASAHAVAALTSQAPLSKTRSTHVTLLSISIPLSLSLSLFKTRDT